MNSSAWEFLGREIQPTEFREIATIVIGFLSVSHIIHWAADHTAYSRWFQTNHTAPDSLDAIGSFKKSKQAMKEAFLIRLGRIEEQTRELEKSIDRNSKVEGVEERSVTLAKSTILSDQAYLQKVVEKQKEIEQRLDEMEAVADDIAPGFKAVSTFANLVIYGWYFCLPLVLALGAVLFMWSKSLP